MARRRLLAPLALAGILGAGAFAVPAAFGTSAAKYTVTATDFKFKLSSTRVAPGVHSFTLVNRGEATHDFRIAGKKTRILNTGQRQTLKVTLKRGRYAYICTVPGHVALGMKGTIVVR